MIWESKDILLDLERRFPQSPPLLPTSDEEQQAAMDFVAELEECGLDKHGRGVGGREGGFVVCACLCVSGGGGGGLQDVS